MNMDRGIHGVGAEDGHLTLNELSGYLQATSKARKSRHFSGLSTTYEDMKIKDGRKLYTEMIQRDITDIKYLPEAILDLASGLRQRACELLRIDDSPTSGEIDQYCIDHARARYHEMHPLSSGALAAKNRALSEIDQLALALGLT